MEGPLSKLRKLQRRHKCPVFFAGDIFHKYNPSAELINFALENLPDNSYAIPGQHDLPYHRYEGIKKSGYWTLVKAGKIQDLVPNSERFILTPSASCRIMVKAFPWGHEITPCPDIKGIRWEKDQKIRIIKVALCHSYIWWADKVYPGAPVEKSADHMRKKLKGYDLAVFGDNHKGFLTRKGGTAILNCGGFMQWKSDEVDYQPKIGLLYKDGSVKRVSIVDTSESQWSLDIDKLKDLETAFDAEDFLRSLTNLGESAINFEEALRRACNEKEISGSVRSIVLEMLEKGQP